MFDPMCLRSGRWSKVERGGGSCRPSRLPLYHEISGERSWNYQTRTNILTFTGKSRTLDGAKENSSITLEGNSQACQNVYLSYQGR